MEESPKQNPDLLKVEREYQRDVALTEAKPVLKRVGLAIWFSIDAILILTFVGYMIFYGVYEWQNALQQSASIANNIESTRAISVARSAQALVNNTARAIPSDEGSYDLYAEIDNLNEDWYATFLYGFETSAGDTNLEPGFILPSESKILVTFSEEFDRRPAAVEIIIEDVKWHRVDAGQISDYEEWVIDYNNFEVEDAVHLTDMFIEGKNIARTSFSITNKTAYSYWSPTFLVMLGRPGSLIAINVVTIPGFESGETRQVDVNWFGVAPGSAPVEVVPNINFLDEDVYMTPGVDVEVDIRDTL